MDAVYSVSEFRFKLWNWETQRRFVVVREELQANKPAVGRKLIDLPGYVFRVFVTNRNDSALEIWRDYNGRAAVECRINELKNELAADHFCLRSSAIARCMASNSSRLLICLGTGKDVVSELVGFERFMCTSSNDGIRSSHSSRVAVLPPSLTACSYIFQTGSKTG